ncbi:GGDEF domain-containing protein [Actinoplanes sp. CA-131856]
MTELLNQVAGRRIHLLSGITIPLYVAGAVVTHGAARWILIVIGACMTAAVAFPRLVTTSGEGPRRTIPAALVTAVWGWLSFDQPQLATTVLAATILYTALMSSRQHAKIGILVMPAAYLAGQWISGTHDRWVLQNLAVALTLVGTGALLVWIRILAEDMMAARAQDLAEANARLEELTRIDPLTGLANRRRLDETLDDVWRWAASHREPISVVMVDVDHFKLYNDTYGHPAGDACLRDIAAQLAKNTRGNDIVARYGGEEFFVVLPGTHLDTACQVAERVRAGVACLQQQHASSPSGFVTVSLGVACMVPADGDQVGHLLQRADHQLYEAKHGGRNQVSPAPEILAGTTARP